jgi:hypothetical protein
MDNDQHSQCFTAMSVALIIEIMMRGIARRIWMLERSATRNLERRLERLEQVTPMRVCILGTDGSRRDGPRVGPGPTLSERFRDFEKARFNEAGRVVPPVFVHSDDTVAPGGFTVDPWGRDDAEFAAASWPIMCNIWRMLARIQTSHIGTSTRVAQIRPLSE